jgi:hypothetical protein
VNIPLTQSQEDCVEILTRCLEKAKNGELISCVVVGEMVTDAYYSEWSRRDNVFGLGGYMMHTALRQMGFADKRDIQK